jgi:hypothetical protein
VKRITRRTFARRRGAPQTALKTPSTTKTRRNDATIRSTKPTPEMAVDSAMKSRRFWVSRAVW